MTAAEIPAILAALGIAAADPHKRDDATVWDLELDGARRRGLRVSLILDARNGVGTWARLSDKRREEFLRQSAQARETSLSNLNNRTTLADCRAISVPTTIVCGEVTTPPDRRTTEIVHGAVPRARLEMISGAGHMSPLSHPQEVARLVSEHLERLKR